MLGPRSVFPPRMGACMHPVGKALHGTLLTSSLSCSQQWGDLNQAWNYSPSHLLWSSHTRLRLECVSAHSLGAQGEQRPARLC